MSCARTLAPSPAPGCAIPAIAARSACNFSFVLDVPDDLRKEHFDPLPAGAPTLLRAGGSAPAALLAPVEARLPGHTRALQTAPAESWLERLRPRRPGRR